MTIKSSRIAPGTKLRDADNKLGAADLAFIDIAYTLGEHLSVSIEATNINYQA